MSVRVKIKVDNKSEYLHLPALALRGLVVFPDSMIHFDVGREKSINAINAAMADDRLIYLVPQIDIDMENPSKSDVYEVGVVAEVKQILKMQDGIVKVMVEARNRAKTVDLEDSSSYLTALVKDYPVNKIRSGRENTAEALVRSIKESFERYISVAPKMSKEVVSRVFMEANSNKLCEYIAANVMFRIEDKMEILKENSLEKRLNFVLKFLTNEYQVLKIEADIKSKVHAELDKNQKEYYLRQQMKTISEELDDGEDTRKESDEYIEKIKELKLSNDTEEKLLKEVKRLEKMMGSSQEAAVIRTYLDTCLSLPWNVYTKEQNNVIKAEQILNKGHYGMEKVKEKVLEILSVRQLAEDVKGQIICLVGPPGVGKTSIASSIAECLGRNFVRFSLGGVRDESEIRGHRRTYVGAMPGKVMSAMINAKSSNPVILLDEIDKLANDFRGDPAAALLEVLDSEQNHAFSDHYIDLPFDLSNVFFIATANNLAAIPAPLRDRMDIIELSSYTREEKFQIAKRHLIPKQLEKNGMKSYVKFSDSGIYEIIDCYTKEAGVRTLERTVVDLLRKCAKIVASGKAEKVTLNKKKVMELLGAEKFKPNNLELKDTIGLANGLAWTSVGGEMLPIEVTVIPKGSGRLELTGSLGDVMKESCKIALSYIKANAERYGIDTDFAKIDIHIHAPEGAVPKDGPSAGITLTTALLSVLTKRSVKGNVAMTGEVTLQGRVLPIGGLKEKAMAAYREGIKTVIIPYDNQPNLDDVDNVVKEQVKFVPVKTIDQAIDVNLN
ncbi:MAG: endopeptidase La [Oscillospiraceae bacterium]|nr:endopeptidase La [Oscillospiraceae bacterium]